MNTYSRLTYIASRICLSVIFLVNGLGIIDQNMPINELIEGGTPTAIAPLLVMTGRVLQTVAGLGLGLGVFPRWSALGLVAFLVPATFVSHAFWRAAGTPAFQPLLLQFCKNLGMFGGLLFIAASANQPTLFPRRGSPLPRDTYGRAA